mmetsp:Transcript_85842/g.265810  ORF Transcript_85842/g.265810 Transcript_85842/m.265810 type:complete len:250 (+) Transcript_85842:3-752(+)
MMHLPFRVTTSLCLLLARRGRQRTYPRFRGPRPAGPGAAGLARSEVQGVALQPSLRSPAEAPSHLRSCCHSMGTSAASASSSASVSESSASCMSSSWSWSTAPEPASSALSSWSISSFSSSSSATSSSSSSPCASSSSSSRLSCLRRRLLLRASSASSWRTRNGTKRCPSSGSIASSGSWSAPMACRWPSPKTSKQTSPKSKASLDCSSSSTSMPAGGRLGPDSGVVCTDGTAEEGALVEHASSDSASS